MLKSLDELLLGDVGIAVGETASAESGINNVLKMMIAVITATISIE